MWLMPLCHPTKAKAVANTAEYPTAAHTPHAHAPPPEVQQLRRRQELHERAAEEDRVSRNRQGRVAFQERHGEHSVDPYAHRCQEYPEVTDKARAPGSQPLVEDHPHPNDGESDAHYAPTCGPLMPEY